MTGTQPVQSLQTPDTVVFFNPAAQKGRAEKKWPEIYRHLRSYGVPIELIHTEPDGKTVDLVRDYLSSHSVKRAVACGGDGTIHEVVNGIMQVPAYNRPPLGLMPFGSGNDTSRSFDYPLTNLEACVQTLCDGLMYPLDLLKVDDAIYSVDAFTAGFDARVLADRNSNKSRRVWPFNKPLLDYVPSIVKEIALYKRVKCDIGIDGNKAFRAKVFNLTIQNTQVYAGGFVLNKKIRARDGLGDLFYWTHGTKYMSEVGTQLAKRASKIAGADNITNELIDLIVKNYKDHQGKQFSIEFDKEVDSQIDGEQYIKKKRYDVAVVPHALNLLIPYNR